MKKLVLLFFSISAFGQNKGSTSLKSKFSVVSLDKMNVVYRGIPNPISIAVNDAKSFKITGDGVVKTDDGKYIIRPGAGTETKVFVEIEKNDGSKVVEEHIFRIKYGLPAPQGVINIGYSTKFENLLFTLEELEEAQIGVYFRDFLAIESEVKQFNLKVPRFPSITISGNTLTFEALELIKKARKKDLIIISEIKANYECSFNGCIKNPSVIVFRLKS